MAKPTSTDWLPGVDLTNLGWWDVVQMVQERYGAGAVAEMANSGFFDEFPSFSEGDRASLGGYIAARQAEQDSDFGDNPIEALAGLTLGTAGFGVGGTTGASLATGNTDNLDTTLALDAAGLATGAGLASLTAPTAAGGSTSLAGAGESFLGPATGTVLEPGVQAAGGAVVNPITASAPVVSGVASGAGPFVPATFGTAAASGLSNLLAPNSGTGTGGGLPTWQQILAGGLPALFGAYAADKQSDAYTDLSREYMGLGAPSRARYEASFAPGFSMESEPGYKDALDQTTKSFLHKASVTGNPVDSPNAWMQTLKDVNSTFAFPALDNYRRLNAGSGGLAALTSAAPGAATRGIDAEKGVYDAIGAGAADIFNPRKSLADLLRDYRL